MLLLTHLRDARWDRATATLAATPVAALEQVAAVVDGPDGQMRLLGAAAIEDLAALLGWDSERVRQVHQALLGWEASTGATAADCVAAVAGAVDLDGLRSHRRR